MSIVRTVKTSNLYFCSFCANNSEGNNCFSLRQLRERNHVSERYHVDYYCPKCNNIIVCRREVEK